MKYWLYLFICISLLCNIHICKAQEINVDSLMQNLPDLGKNICLSAIVADEESCPKEATDLLYRNIDRLTSSCGVLNISGDSRFFLAVNHNVLTKDVVPGIPTRISETIQFNFIIADAQEEKVFSSIAVQVKGVGINENKAFIAAIRNIKWGEKSFTDFLIEGCNKIESYYTNCTPQIITESTILAQKGQYNEALGKLISIPSACPQYKDCLRLSLKIYQDMINNQANLLLRQAKGEWAKSPNQQGAERAIALIDSIPTETKYEPEISEFISEINNKISELNKQEWEFKKQQYEDSIRHVKQEERQRLLAEYNKTHPQISNSFTRSTSSSGNGIFGNLADKWNAQPTWKKVLIGGGVGLAVAGVAAAATISSVASTLLARTMFHVILPIKI